ncbi:MAG: hypothetical protein CVU06_11820 [Bacteroidetes bacterium HGW-Bacteroidetes-22]|nr:MAG: hypothetical protein CVU06_11820 [Bacteroidetes bacterium HGW-Bacteroidetes-22]
MKRDNYLFGLVLGIVIPAITFAAVWGLNSLIILPSGEPYLDLQRLGLLSMLPNIALIRYYLVKLNAGKTGRMLVAVTCFAVIALFLVPNLMN